MDKKISKFKSSYSLLAALAITLVFAFSIALFVSNSSFADEEALNNVDNDIKADIVSSDVQEFDSSNLLNESDEFDESSYGETSISTDKELLNAIEGEYFLTKDILISIPWAPINVTLNMNGYGIYLINPEDGSENADPKPVIELYNGAELVLHGGDDLPGHISGGKDSGIKVNNSKLILDNVKVSENNTTQYGGGLSADYTSYVEVYNSTIYENFAPLGGGGVYIGSGSCFYVEDSSFHSNKANIKGGAIYLEASSFDINGCSIYGNELRSVTERKANDEVLIPCYGAGICFEQCAPTQDYYNTIFACEIYKNKAINGNGAGIANVNLSEIKIASAQISANVTEMDGSWPILDVLEMGCGGGIYNSHICEINHAHKSDDNPKAMVEISDNEAMLGGGIYHCGLIQPAAYLLCDTPSLAIERNRAIAGGGIFTSPNYGLGQGVIFNNGVIANNEAKICGGGICNLGKLTLGSERSLETGAVVTNNRAGRYGAGIASGDFNNETFLPSTWLILNNCQISENTLSGSHIQARLDLSIKQGCQPYISQSFMPNRPVWMNIVDDEGNTTLGRLTTNYCDTHQRDDLYEHFIYTDGENHIYQLS